MRFARSLAAFGAATTGIVGSAILLGGRVPPPVVASVPASRAGAIAARPAPNPVLSAISLAAHQALMTGAAATSGPSIGPSIVVTSPVRGSFTTQGAALVQGSVTDPSGVTLLTIDGNPVPFDANGNFSEAVGLTPGLNTIDIAAVNSLHVANKVAVAVVYGQFQPDNAAIGDALSLRLNQGSFDAVSKVVSSKLSGGMLSNALMARNPLAHWSSWIGSAKVECTGASFGAPSVVLAPEQGDIRVHVEIPAVHVSLHESGSGIIPSLSGHVSCDDAVLDARIAVSVANGQVTTSVVGDSVDLRNFQWGIDGLPDFVTGLFTGLVRDAVQGEIANVVKSQLPPEVNKMIAGATGQPITQSILGHEATFNLAPRSLAIDANGMDAAIDADCSLAAVPGYTPLPAPGSLISSGPVPHHGGPGPDFFASINEDLLNRAGYAVWKSGVAQIRIDDSPSSAFHMPPGYPLDMGLLLTFLPELQGTADPSDPLALCVTPLLPPVFKATRKPDTLEASLGEIRMDFVDTKTNQSIVTIAVHVRVGATVSLGAGNRFTIHMSNRPIADASLVSAAAANMNTIGIDNVISLFLPTIVQIAGNQWSGFLLPTYPGLVPAATSVIQDGGNGTFVTCAGNFEPNGAPLPTGNSSLISVIAASGALRAAASSAGTFAARGAFTTTTTTSVARSAILRARIAKLGPIVQPIGGTTTTITTPASGPTVLPGEQITSATGYVALVEDGLEQAVAPLLQGYASRGVSVALVPLSHVTAQGKDRAAEIKSWLVAHCHDGKKRYLLLVGGPNAIPFRTCQPSKAVTPVVSDLYYGDLQNDWDANGDGVYGELDDHPGFDPELYVGRLPFDDAASVAKAVSAIETARANHGASSRRCFLVGATTIVPGDDPIGAETVKALAFAPQGWDVKTAYAPESFLRGDMVLGSTTIVDEENASSASLLMTFSHGSTKGLMSHPDATTWHDVLTIPQLSQINASVPPVEIAVACNTADPTNGPCVGSISLQNGFAGWVGCTVVTDPRSGAGGWLLATVELAQEVAAGTSLGQALGDTMRDFVATGRAGTFGNPDAEADLEQQAMSWIIYGDPGLCLGPKAP